MKVYIKKALFVITGCLIFSYLLQAGNTFAQQRIELKPETKQAVPPITPERLGEATISLEIKGMDIVDVLKMLALRGNMNIVAGKNVRGKVTVFLKDVDIMDALEIILISNDLAYDMKGDIINVMTNRDYEAIYGEKFQDKKKLKIAKLKYGKAAEVSKALNQIKSRVGKVVIDEISNTIVIMDAPQIVLQMEELIQEMDLPTQTKVFALNYSKAETIKTGLETFLTKGIGVIQVDERTNKIIVTDLKENMGIIEKAVAEFDEKTKEVLIEAKILQITLNDEYKAGINWDAVFAGVNTNLGMNFDVLTGTPIPTTASDAATGIGLSVGGLNTSYNYEVMLEMLQQYGKTNLLSTPSILTVNNEEAKILVGTNQPYATSQTTTPATGAATTSYQVTFLDLGVKLYVTPTINRDGFVTMKIKPEVSSKETQDYTYGPNNDAVPVVKTSQAETTVMVKDGTTIVIAGLIEDRQAEVINQVPILGSIPLLGALFRNRSTGSSSDPEKNELVIFLTPHIISGEEESPEVGEYALLVDTLERQLMQEEIRKAKEAGKPEAVKEEQKPEKKKVKPTKTKKAVLSKKAPRKEIDVDKYYGVVRRKIFEKVRENYPGKPIKGKVHLSFCIARDGSLKGTPALIKPAKRALTKAAIKAVKAAAPFPPFPRRFKKKEEIFNITVIYE